MTQSLGQPSENLSTTKQTTEIALEPQMLDIMDADSMSISDRVDMNKISEKSPQKDSSFTKDDSKAFEVILMHFL